MNKNLNNTIAPITISSNGIEVFPHPEGHSHRPDLDAEAIGKIILPEGTFCRTTVDMGRTIGKDHLVEVNPFDIEIMWQRGSRPGKSHMVIKEADDTSYVTLVLCVAHEEDGTPAELVGKWVLVTLFEGCPGEREPFDRSFENGKNPEGKELSEKFWKTHALVPTDEEAKDIIAWAKQRAEEIDNYEGDPDDNFAEDELITNLLEFYGESRW